MKQAPRRRSPRLPRSGFRLPGFSALAAPLSRAASLLRGSAGSRLLAAIRSLGARSSKAPKPRFAIAAILAGVLAAAFGLTFLLGEPSFPMPEAALLPEGEASPSALLDYASPELADGAGDSDQGSSNLPPVPAALEMSSYTVRSSDSLASIARRFGLNVDTLISVNGISSARSLRSGAQLRVPNINGLVYKVRPGDSLASVAKRYKMDPTKIVDVNDLGTADLSVGQSLFIPGARLPQAVVSQAMGQAVAWPARGPLSSFFGYRPDPFTGVRRFHAGIDIAVDQGTVVRAAMSGRVSDTGFNANYGNYIIMNHADGFQTLYGHLSSILVHEGMSVDQGAQIGLSGSTGYSTGPHLHFGIFRRSLALNPLKFLK
jgi:LysM repeat protein